MLRYFAAELKERGKGSAQDNINLRTFEHSTFPFPSLKKQTEVIEKLSTIGSVIAETTSRYNDNLTDLTDLRQSLLQKAFGGELT